MVTPTKTDMTGLNMTIFGRRHMIHLQMGCFSTAMLVVWGCNVPVGLRGNERTDSVAFCLLGDAGN